MNKIEAINPYSLVSRDFFWVAEYLDGHVLQEYDLKNNKYNLFDNIQKDQVLRFGYLGHGYRFYFDVPTGIFNIANNKYSFYYKTNSKEYELTNQSILYNDLISYKDCYVDCDFSGREKVGNVVSYNFGYKAHFQIEDVHFYYKAIMHIPIGIPMYFTVRLVADKDLDGWFEVHKNGFKCADIKAPLSRDNGQKILWNIEV